MPWKGPVTDGPITVGNGLDVIEADIQGRVIKRPSTIRNWLKRAAAEISGGRNEWRQK